MELVAHAVCRKLFVLIAKTIFLSIKTHILVLSNSKFVLNDRCFGN